MSADERRRRRTGVVHRLWLWHDIVPLTNVIVIVVVAVLSSLFAAALERRRQLVLYTPHVGVTFCVTAVTFETDSEVSIVSPVEILQARL